MDDSDVCPGCNIGSLTIKCGKYGPFFGCSEFPRCHHAESISDYSTENGVPDAYVVNDDEFDYSGEEY